MIELTAGKLIFIFIMCIFAGFVDSVAGGGGLISLTSYYLIGLPPTFALGNNKFSSSVGTLFASVNYARKRTVVWKVALFTSVFALIGSAIGAHLALLYATTVFQYVLLFVLPLITAMTFMKKKTESKGILEYEVTPSGSLKVNSDFKSYLILMVLGLLIGIYDGFFGPGTGMFYTVTLTFLGLPIINAAGTTRIINLASNIAAVTTFIAGGTINYKLGLPCVFASVMGNLIGSEFAVKKGSRGIKPVILFVIVLLYIKILLDLFK